MKRPSLNTLPEESWCPNGTADGVASLLTFKNPLICRGMPISLALHGCGKIFVNSQGSGKTYSLSQTCSRLNIFLSHNWSTPRELKFLALALRFNFNKAVWAMCVTCAVCIGAVGTGTMSDFETLDVGFDLDGFNSSAHGNVCLFLGLTVFWGTIFFGHELDFLRRGKGHYIFLDKTCIHQTDMSLKNEGIESLGAFLANSDKLIILYSPLYFKKIWTVYEVACFLCTKSTSDCIFLPVDMSKFGISAHACLVLWHIITATAPNWAGGLSVLFLMGCLLMYVVFMYGLCRFHVLKYYDLQCTLKSFKLSNATCFDESDRPVVYKAIVYFMKYIKHVRMDATDRQALRTFEREVQTQMGDVVQSLLGRTGLTYRQLLVIGVPFFLIRCDILATAF